MYFEIITLLIVVVSPFVLAWYITVKINESGHRDRVRQDRVTARVDKLSRETMEAIQAVVKYQTALDDAMSDLLRFIGAQKTYAHFQQEQFNTLAKSDMLAARREELLRTKELKVALERLMGVALTSRQPAAPNDILAMENLTSRIENLETILGDDVR
jgi:hypothetical protein